MDGVEAVITCLDSNIIWHAGERAHSRQVFANHVRFVGDCIGAVAARTRDIARDAVDAITVEYEELPNSLTTLDSMGANAPKIWEDSNVIGPIKFGFGNLERTFNEADYIFEVGTQYGKSPQLPSRARYFNRSLGCEWKTYSLRSNSIDIRL